MGSTRPKNNILLEEEQLALVCLALASAVLSTLCTENFLMEKLLIWGYYFYTGEGEEEEEKNISINQWQFVRVGAKKLKV